MRFIILCATIALLSSSGCSCSSIAASSPEVATGVVASAPLVRVSLPLHQPVNSNVIFASLLSTTGGPGSTPGLVVQIPDLPVGATILQLDARIRDSVVGPTKVALAFGDQIDGGFQEPALAAGPPSSGAGAFQPITLTNIGRIVQPLHVYYAWIMMIQGSQPVAVSAIDVTYQAVPEPPPSLR